MAEAQAAARLSRGQRVAVGVSVTLGLGLAACGVAGSYQTLSGLAERRGVPLASLVPVGIDGGLIGVVVLDLVLSWIGQTARHRNRRPARAPAPGLFPACVQASSGRPRLPLVSNCPVRKPMAADDSPAAMARRRRIPTGRPGRFPAGLR
jgi:hypothetical protein